MAVKSLIASGTKLALVFLVCIAILAPQATVCMAAVATPDDSTVPVDPSIKGCAELVLDATMCVTDIIKVPIAPHPACCKAISVADDCSTEFLKHIPPSDLSIIKKICAL